MTTRLLQYTKLPWTGGLNDSVDSGVLPDDDLVTADNVVFTTSGARVKRDGREYIDTASQPPATASRSSTGTTRTIVFASELRSTSPTVDRLVPGERITVSSPNATVNSNYGGTATILTVSSATITYALAGSLTESSTADTTLVITRPDPYISVTDFYWYDVANNVKQHEIIAVQKVGTIAPFPINIFKYDTAGRRALLVADSPGTDDDFSAAVTNQVVTKAMNEKLILAFDGTGNKPRVYDPNSSLTEYKLLPGTPPDFSIMEVVQGRLFTNNKNNKDRLEYSPPGDTDTWNGTGDSGAIDIFPGDGDPVGLSALRLFKGTLFMGKKAKLYRLLGDSPENFTPDEVSGGLGVEAPLAFANVDQNDSLYVSEKGIHALGTTDQYGDFAGTELSAKIQNTFNSFAPGELRYTQAVYVSSLNSVAFAVAERGRPAPTALYLYNIKLQTWYRWPNINPRSLCLHRAAGVTPRLLIGTADSRLALAQSGEYVDFDDQPILYKIKTGAIYPDSNPQASKAFKKLSMYFKPKGNFSFTVKVKIDNYSPQILNFTQSAPGDKLGDTFVLGESTLSFDSVLAPYTQEIDGYGRGVTLEIEQTGLNEQVEIYGFTIWYEPVGAVSETINSNDL